MKRKITYIVIVFTLACLIGPTSIISADLNQTTPPLVVIDCGNIEIDTDEDPDLCICLPIDHLNINVGAGGEVRVEVDYEIDCTSWDDHGYVKIWFVEWPNIKDEKETGEYASGTLIISQVILASTEFYVGLYAHIWYDFGGPESEDTEYSQCSTAPYYPNNPPNKPSKPSGPTSVTINVENSWTSSATDPDGDQVYLRFQWGDGYNSGWLGPVDSGEIVTGYHTYTQLGFYQIFCEVKDEHEKPGPNSDWLEIHCKLSHEH